jgi:uncharacterized protein (DUF1800 family)
MLSKLPAGQWNAGAAAHLLNRAGFGGSPAEIGKFVALGLDGAVSRLLDYDKIPDETADPDWAKPDPSRVDFLKEVRAADPQKKRELQQGEQRKQRERLIELKHWWLARMAAGPRPLQEKMTLFWHGHFATSMDKVRDAYLMWKQNDLFRRMATGNWLEMLVAVARDPAMLIWLDQGQSRRQHPNENFAREVMELFTLGEGHYTEKDVTEAARALTGWSYDFRNQEFIERPFFHDNGDKTFLGRAGDLDGRDVLEEIVEQPQAARFITAKLWTFFAGEPPSDAVTDALANTFRSSGNEFKPVLREMFSSAEFYSDRIVRNEVKSPVQWLVQSVRELERPLPGPMICFGLTRGLGQDLFAPPNVKGWDGGLSWITTSSLLMRYNAAALLVEGDATVVRGMVQGIGAKALENPGFQNRLQNLQLPTVDVSRILSDDDRADKAKLVAALERRLLQGKLTVKQEQTLTAFLDGQAVLDDTTILKTIRLMMSTPEYQLT